MATYDVVATGEGLEVTTTPQGLAAQMGEPPTTQRYVALSGPTFITTEPEDGSHSTFTFLDGGQYLFGGRLARRV